MKIPLTEIALASKCLRLNQFQKEQPLLEEDKNSAIARAVIQKAYLKVLKTGWKAEWKKIIGWVDKLVFIDLNVGDTFEFEQGRTRSEYILKFLDRWYLEHHLPEQPEAWVDVALEQDMDRFWVTGVAQVIKLVADQPTVMYITDKIVSSPIQLYNNIELRGLMWLVGESLGKPDQVALEYLGVGPQGGISREVIYASKEDNERTGEMIRQVGSLVCLGLDYPSVSQQCTTCQFRRRCRI